MRRTALLNIVGLTPSLIDSRSPNLEAFAKRHVVTPVEPSFPAVTCTAQSTYLTGEPASGHGAVANGWYDRGLAEHQFWKQSNHLIEGKKLWEVLREQSPEFTCAKLFWWYNMYSTADFSITPRPIYPADGRKVFDVYTHPMEMREQLKADLGDFPFPAFWGPMAGIASSRWIAESAKWVERHHEPTLSLVYLPHLDYDLQKFGPQGSESDRALAEIDELFGELLTFYEARGVELAVLSEYGISAVDRPIHLNRIFRERGWIAIKDELGKEMIDLGASKVFAIADHQVAHVYLNDPSVRDEVERVLQSTDGVGEVLDDAGKQRYGIAHSRSGDFVAIADAKSWFTYYYWMDDKLAPDYARCVDIHRKPGYDPAELFVDPSLRFPKAKVISRLVRKKLGFRMLMDVIPLDATLVRGSHGRIPEHQDEWPVLIGDFGGGSPTIAATDVFKQLLGFCSPGGA